MRVVRGTLVKVIKTQLNSNKRKELCCLQGVDYSYESVFSEIEPLLLPEILSLVGGKYGHDELYRMLIATAPDLASIISRQAVIEQKLVEIKARMSELVAEKLKSNEELALLIGGSRGKNQSATGEDKESKQLGTNRGRIGE